MSNDELKELYKYACQYKGYTPQEGQYLGWKKQFSFFESRDLRAAIDEWYRGSNAMPMPSDLLPAILRSQQSRTVETSTPRSLVVWQCPVCRFEKVGFLTALESAFRKCPSFYGPNGTILPLHERCGAEMYIFKDERLPFREAYADRKVQAANG